MESTSANLENEEFLNLARAAAGFGGRRAGSSGPGPALLVPRTALMAPDEQQIGGWINVGGASTIVSLSLRMGSPPGLGKALVRGS